MPTYVSRNPFARQETFKRIYTRGHGTCRNCGGHGRDHGQDVTWQFGVANDGGHGIVWDSRGGFCGKRCRDVYFNG